MNGSPDSTQGRSEQAASVAEPAIRPASKSLDKIVGLQPRKTAALATAASGWLHWLLVASSTTPPRTSLAGSCDSTAPSRRRWGRWWATRAGGVQHVAEQRRRKLLPRLAPAGCHLQPRIVKARAPAAVGRNHEQPRPFLEEAAALAVHESHDSLHAHARHHRIGDQRLRQGQRRRRYGRDGRDVEGDAPNVIQVRAHGRAATPDTQPARRRRYIPSGRRNPHLRPLCRPPSNNAS